MPNVGYVTGLDLSGYPIILGDDWRAQLQLTEEINCVETPIDLTTATNLLGALAVNNTDLRIFTATITVTAPAANGWISVLVPKAITATMFPGNFELHIRMDLSPWGTKTWVLQNVPVIKGILT